MNKTIVPIKGMHCRSCEVLISEKLRELPEIKNVSVNFRKNEAVIHSEYPLNLSKVRQKVNEAGYEVGKDDSKSWISLNPNEYKDLVVSLIVLLVLYFIAKKFGLFNISLGRNNPSGYLVVLLVGLTAGISTCMALVGGLVLGISARHAEVHPEATSAQKFRPHLYFNIGRVASFFLLGGLVGLVGKAFQLSGTSLGIMTIIVGIVMLILGLQLTELFPRLSSGTFTLPSGISGFLGLKKRHNKEYSHLNSMIIGALTFFLPCGFTQAMQLYAMSTGSFFSGAIIMGVFALGTLPGLLGIGGLTSVLKGSFAKKFFKFAGLLVIALAIFNIGNGYRLTGWRNVFNVNKKSPVATAEDPNVKIENGIQVVRMDQVGNGYNPNKFTIKNNIPVKWIIDSKSSGSCAASIYMQKMGIRKFLNRGENIIEFTPNEVGDIRFTCSMGMYSGKFVVVEYNGVTASGTPTVPVKASETPSPLPTPSPTSTLQEITQKSATPVSIAEETSAQSSQDQTQVIKATYNTVSLGAISDISPYTFTVSAGEPVRFEIAANADGEGCMSTIMIPGLVNTPEILRKGQTIKWEFTPEKGTYDITCAMGVPRGEITAI